MSKKQIIGILGILILLGIFLNAYGKFLNVSHWYEIGFNLSSYHPSLPIISFIGAFIYLIVAYFKDAHWYFWVIGILWLAYASFMLYGVAITYWGLV